MAITSTKQFQNIVSKTVHLLRPENFYLLIFLTPFIVNPHGTMPFSIPKHAWAVGVIALFSAITTIRLIKTKKITFAYNKSVLAVIGLWLLSITLSTIFSVSPLESFWGSYERMQGAISIFYYAIHFVICLQLLRTPESQNTLFKLILTIGSVLSIHAILQQFGIDPMQIGKIEEVSGRSHATIGQPNLLGQYLLLPIIASAIFSQSTKTKTWKLIFRIIFLLTFAGLITTMNRASILALAITAGLYILYNLKIQKRALILASFLLVSLAIASTFTLAQQSRSFQSRQILWNTAMPLIKEKPLLGYGLETYYQTAQKVISKDLFQFETLYKIPDRIHNETLQIFLDQGIFGGSLYIITILFIIWCFINRKAKSIPSKIALFFLIASAITNQFSFPETIHYLVILVSWAVLLNETFKSKTFKLNLSAPLIITATIALIIFSGYSIHRSATITLADTEFTKGISAYFQSYDDARTHFQNALSLNPNYRYLPYNTLHLLSTKEYLRGAPKNKQQLQQYLERTCELNNNSYHCNIAEAKFYSALGNTEKSEQSYKQASEKAPNFPTIYQDWGESAYKQGAFETAITQLETLKDLAPDYWQSSAQTTRPNEHRIFKKTHSLFYSAMFSLMDSYQRIGQTKKAEELMTQLY